MLSHFYFLFASMTLDYRKECWPQQLAAITHQRRRQMRRRPYILRHIVRQTAPASEGAHGMVVEASNSWVLHCKECMNAPKAEPAKQEPYTKCEPQVWLLLTQDSCLFAKEFGTSGNSAVPSTHPTWDLWYMNWRMQNCKTVICARGLGLMG